MRDDGKGLIVGHAVGVAFMKKDASLTWPEWGDLIPKPARRFKIVGILREGLRQKTLGGIKYAKPVGVIAGLC